MPGRRTADPVRLAARISQSGCLSLYNSQVLANATGLGCNCSDDVLTSRRTHMSVMSAQCHAVVDSMGSGSADTRTYLRVPDGSDVAAKLHRDEKLHRDDRRFCP
jgi:hypothetical protein